MVQTLFGVTLAWGLGLVLAATFPLRGWLAVVLVIVGLGTFFFLRRRPSQIFCKFFLIALTATLYLPLWRTFTLPADGLAVIGREPVALEGVILAVDRSLPDFTRLKIQATGRLVGQRIFPVAGRFLLTCPCALPGYAEDDRVRVLGRLNQPQNFKNAGGFDWVGFLARKGMSHVMNLASADLLHPIQVSQLGRRHPWEQAFVGLREPIGSVMKALILGDESRLTGTIQDLFRDMGLSHILVVSGLNLGMMAWVSFSLLMLMARRMPWLLRRVVIVRWLAIFNILAVLSYLVVLPMSASVMRASVFIFIYLAAIVLGREISWRQTMLVTVLILLIVDPRILWDLGAWFSFVSLLGIFVFLDWTQPRRAWSPKQRRIPWFYELAGSSLAAYLATLPLTAAAFGQVSWIGPLTNLWVVPVVGVVVVPLGFLATLVGCIFPVLGQLMMALAAALMEGVVFTLQMVHRHWEGAIWVVRPQFFHLILLGFIVALYFFRPWRGRWVVVSVLSGLMVATLLPWPTWSFLLTGPRVTMVDVGQGDAVVVQSSAGETILIDTGGAWSENFDIGERVLMPWFMAHGILSLDALIITHADHDHYGGALFLVAHLPIKEIGINGQFTPQDDRFRKFLAVVAGQGIPLKIVDARAPPQRIGGTLVEILHPPQSPPHASLNEGSLVLRLAWSGDPRQTLLIPGDIGVPTEQSLVATRRGSLQATILKVPHHGSKTSSSEGFLAAVDPLWAIIGVRENNPWGHPHPQVLERYQRHGIKVLRTDRDGQIDLEWQRDHWEVHTLCEKKWWGVKALCL